MQHFFVILLVCLFPFSLSAVQIDAKSILEQTIVAFQKADGIKASFTIHIGGESLSSGEICLKGKKFVLKANDVITWFDGRTQWTYMVSSDEVTITEPTTEELQAINPYAYLSLDTQGYRLDLNSKASDTKFYDVLFTANRIQEPRYVMLSIDKQIYLPICIAMEQRNGEIIKIVINSCQIHQSFPDNSFVFDAKKYPQAEEIDLR